VFKMTPAGVPGLTRTTRVKVTFAPVGNDAVLRDTKPVPRTGGVEQVQPSAVVRDTNVVKAGVGSSRTTSAASAGPALSTVIV